MLIKPCNESVELRKLRSLDARMELTRKEKQHYLNLQKGYIGEKFFEKEWLEPLTTECYILNDLLLEHNNSFFQIDTVLILQKLIYLLDVKNYNGDFYIQDDNWYTMSGTKIKDPVMQLNRCETILRGILNEQRINMSVKSHLIFINPEFTLYHAPLKSPCIFPTQIKRFMNDVNMSTSKLTDLHAKLSDLLLAKQVNRSPFELLPEYNYEHLEKGITCVNCNSLMSECKDGLLICGKCGYKEKMESAVIRTAKEFQLLFPERKITTNSIYEWCKGINSKKLIRRILKDNYTHVKHARFSYFENTNK
jgi:ribosomal protein S27AE